MKTFSVTTICSDKIFFSSSVSVLFSERVVAVDGVGVSDWVSSGRVSKLLRFLELFDFLLGLEFVDFLLFVEVLLVFVDVLFLDIALLESVDGDFSDKRSDCKRS